MRKFKVLYTILISGIAGTALAQQEQGLNCYFTEENLFLPLTTLNPEQSPVDLKADDVQLQNDILILSGNVEISRVGNEFRANRATYDRNSGDIKASGDVRLRDSEIIVDAEQAEWSMDKKESTMLDAHYRIRQMHARGQASHLLRKGKENTVLKNASYTTCFEGDDAWLLDAEQVYLDHEKGIGEAEDVVLRLGGVPVFFTPYISFPLNDERKSGFLPPSIGRSDETGFDLMTPYYWNIAPNMDATLTPRYMSDRGLMLGGQFRYLSQWGEGEIEANFLGSDKLRKNGEDINPYFDKDRELFTWQHQSYLPNQWRVIVDYNYVSDKNYFEDFGSSLSLSSRAVLNRLFETGYVGDVWNFTARMQSYQMLVDEPQQYKRLPQLQLSAYLPDRALGLTYEFDAEYVEFEHKQRIEGQRLNFEPAVSLPMGSSAFFATPRLAFNHTRYNLKNDELQQFDDNASRSLPIVSFDTGLFFDRELSIGEASFLQTFEPRAFYLYIPERNQAAIPIFDTSLSTFNMVRLFSYDRFIGGDRIGDANQLSLAVTSRIISKETGDEKLRLTLGQIRYFDDRHVTLPNGSRDNASDSDIIAEAVGFINKVWSVSGEVQWDPGTTQLNMSSFGLRYRNDQGGIFNMSHRYRRDGANITSIEGLEQVDISAQVPINERWQLFGRWYRSIKQGKTLEALAGIQYDSCCWATRLAIRNYVNDVLDKDRNLAVYFQVELKGLGTLGKRSDSLLETSIRGYQAD